MKIITITNRKGGVGKTTIAVHLAAGLAMRGYRIGLVDLDSQGHVAVTLGLDKQDALYAALIDQQPVASLVQQVPAQQYAPTESDHRGELFALLSDKLTFRIPFLLENASSFIILDMLESFADAYQLDYVLVDTQPTMNLLDTALYAATDAYVFVTECEALSFDGIVEIQEQVATFAKQRQRYLHRETRLLGIIPNRMRADTILHRTNISNLSKAFPGLVLPPVILRIAWAEAFNLRQLVYTYSPDGKESADAWMIVDRIEKRLIEWLTTRSDATA